MKLFVICICLFLFSTATIASPEVGKPAPSLKAIDTYGNQVDLNDFKGSNVVLEWTNHQCPYVKKYYGSGAMQRLQRKLTEESVVWLSIISSAEGKQGYVNADKANELSASRGVYASKVLLDPKGIVGRAYKARTTPQMFLIDKAGIILYMGAIDDRPSANPKSLVGAFNYLDEAWQLYKQDKEIDITSTKPYGCSVKY